MSAATEDINVEEKLSALGKQDTLLSNGADNLFAPDTGNELYADGDVNGALNTEDSRVG